MKQTALHPRRQRSVRAILDAASTLFRERGFDAVTMDDIALRAGLARATLYYNFEAKEEIAVAIASHDREAALLALKDHIERQSPAIDLLRGVFKKVGQSTSDLPEVSRIAMLSALKDESKSAEPAALSTRLLIAEIIKLGQSQGQFRTDVSVHEMTMLIVGLLLQITLVGSGADSAPPQSWAERLLEIALDGLAPRDGKNGR